MSDYVFGDKVARDKNTQIGDHNTFTVTNLGEVSRADVDAAIAELRTFIAQLRRDGLVAADGSVTDPAKVVTAIESHPSRLKALGKAIAGGAKDAVLSVVRDSVATLIVALVGRM
jgi:hypothetical protein